MEDQRNTISSSQVKHPTWNLVAVIVFVALALTDIMPVLLGHLWHPLP